MSKYLDNNGLLYLWQKIKTLLGGKVDKAEGKGLSTNDYTTDEKTKLSGIEEGANKTTVENVLTSSSTTNALSAAQGKALNDKIAKITTDMGDLGGGDMMKATYDANDDGVVDNAAALGGQAPSYYAKADGTNIAPAFTPASTRANVASGEALPTLLGKIAKYFADLKTVAFSGSYNDLSDKPDIPTVTHDLTDALKANYDAAYAHSQGAHAPSNAQANVIESILVNGTAIAPSGKAVSITVPTTVAALSDAAQYAKKSDLTNVYKYKGSVAAVSALPASATAGDVYNVEDSGMNYAWDGKKWDALGEIFEIETISNAEIDAVVTS